MKTPIFIIFSFIVLNAGIIGFANPESEKSKKVFTLSLTSEEIKLARMINEYRASKGLEPIQVSRSLSYVAKAHAIDLSENLPVTNRCNMHSWSRGSEWKGCCYTDDHKNAKCMWDKPREMTNYQGNGYEIAHGSTSVTYQANAQSALSGWKTSRGHNSVIVNEGSWKNIKWKGMGIGIYNNYAIVWFGDQQDPDGYISFIE